jgi:cyclopropane fatty-acyl-phospholipid synthase-like methyltransferase
MAEQASKSNELYEGYSSLKGWGDAPSISDELAEYYRLEMQRASFSAGQKVLELGFGEGTFLDWAYQQGAEVSGVELLEDVCELARRRHPRIFCGGLPELIASEAITGPFDLIVAFDVFEHLTKEELLEYFRAFHSLLSPGGLVLARFPNGQSPFGRTYQNGDITHKTALSEFSMRQIGTLTNFRLVKAYNAARTLSSHPVKRVHRQVVYQLRNALEWAVSQLYFTGPAPMDMNMTVVMQKEG